MAADETAAARDEYPRHEKILMLSKMMLMPGGNLRIAGMFHPGLQLLP
ncbi:hypothetical protein [Rhodobacter sp. CZR27]|nr:hypothetical protein [Rhodobacter sp. CZR27]